MEFNTYLYLFTSDCLSVGIKFCVTATKLHIHTINIMTQRKHN